MASNSNQRPPTLKQFSRPNSIKIKPDPFGRSGNVTSATIPYARVKTEPNTGDSATIRSERLPSIRSTRDLTLGGIPSSRSTAGLVRPNLGNANKKVFTPNLIVTRNKNADVRTSRDTTVNHRGRGRNERGGRGAGRGAGRGGASRNSALITSSGLFSEGAGDGTSKRLMGRSRGANNSNETTTLKRPTIVKKEKLDPLLEQKHIKDLYDLDDDVLMDDDTALSSDKFTPINLLDVKPDVKVENGVSEESTSSAYPSSLGELFNRTSPQMFLLQLPDTLPGHGPIEEPAESAEHENPLSADADMNYCTLSQLEEGQIGRIVRYRSGNTKLILGETQYDIDLGIDPGVLQELVSITTNPIERSGNIFSLGNVGAKLSAIPDWEFILNKSEREKS